MIDNKAEKYFSWSPYSYCLNNPVIFIDPKGEDVFLSKLYERNEKGELINKRQVLAFELFSITKEGRTYLKKNAQKGFKGTSINYFISKNKYNE